MPLNEVEEAFLQAAGQRHALGAAERGGLAGYGLEARAALSEPSRAPAGPNNLRFILDFSAGPYYRLWTSGTG